VHARLESQLGMRIIYKLREEQIEALKDRYLLSETMRDLAWKLTYTAKLAMVRGFKDGAPYGVLDKINNIKNDFGHPIQRQ